MAYYLVMDQRDVAYVVWVQYQHFITEMRYRNEYLNCNTSIITK